MLWLLEDLWIGIQTLRIQNVALWVPYRMLWSDVFRQMDDAVVQATFDKVQTLLQWNVSTSRQECRWPQCRAGLSRDQSFD